jgi:hypothetical protein
MKQTFLILVLLAMPSVAEAKRYREVQDGKEVVVHTRLAPVLLHHALPPNVGRHVYVPGERSQPIRVPARANSNATGSPSSQPR